MKKLIAILLIITLNSCSTEELNTGLNIEHKTVWGNYSVPGDNSSNPPQTNDRGAIRVKVEQHKITIYNENGTIREEITEGYYKNALGVNQQPQGSFKLFKEQVTEGTNITTDWFFQSFHNNNSNSGNGRRTYTITYKKNGEQNYVIELVKNIE